MAEPCDFSTWPEGEIRSWAGYLTQHAPRDVVETSAQFMWGSMLAPGDGGTPPPCDFSVWSEAQVRKWALELTAVAPLPVVENSAHFMWAAMQPVEPPPPADIIRHGVIVVDWASVTQWKATVGKLSVLRVYPSGKISVASVDALDKGIGLYPGVPILWSCFMAGRNFSDGDMVAFTARIKAAAVKVPKLVIAIDAEPDRKDRPYTDAQFMDGFRRLYEAIQPLPANVELCLNLTGWDFANRISRYDAIMNYYTVLGIDPYWFDKAPNGVQASESDITTASNWAIDHQKEFILGEWGVEIKVETDPTLAKQAQERQAKTVTRSLTFLAGLARPPSMAPYFQAAGPFDARLTGEASWTAYKTHPSVMASP